MFNRLANSKNEYQGPKKRVLCVCSAGLLRSPTVAWVLSNPPYDCNTRAAGVEEEYALIPADRALVHWADEIVCASTSHRQMIKDLLVENGTPDKKIYCLDIPDRFGFRDSKLVKIIESKLKECGFKGSDL